MTRPSRGRPLTCQNVFMELSASYLCPHCGEIVDATVDPSGLRHQEYVEDCPVCCRPNLLSVQIDASGEASVTAQPQ